MTVGDTAYYDRYYEFGITTVFSTDSVDFNGRERKRMFLTNNDVWVEGIGSLEGILRPIWATPLGCGSPAYTFCGNYVDSAQAPYQICTDFFLSTDEATHHDLLLFPNPNNGAFTISATNAGGKYTVYDVLGRAVSAGITTEVRTTIELDHATPGTYWLRIDGRSAKLMVE